MDYFYAIIFGIIQGATEFIPISSSAHLIIFHKIINLPINNELAFDVFLHLASFLAIIIFFKKDIFQLCKSFFKQDKNRLPYLIILATIPAAVAGYFLENLIDNNFRSLHTIFITLIIGGCLFLIVEKIGKKLYNLDKLNWKNSLIIGFAQALAIIPGVSRSGITITAGMFFNLKRETAVRFSFLLSAPIILGASITQIPQLDISGLPKQDIYILLIAFIFSFLSSFFAIKFFISFVKKYSLKIFAYYRFILALIILLFLIF
ncbi:MAG: undecaprenyl-diphosphatase UppP [Patescibacteria group bacterium]|nr:undecaprenyl-diphosphatase UppP [Patescibacteria group bacterium]